VSKPIDERFARLSLEIIKTAWLEEGSRPLAKLVQDWGLGKQPQECLWVIAYDAAGGLRTIMEVARGGHTELQVDLPSLLTAVLVTGAEVFSVAHNHPVPESVAPSVSDGALNHAIMNAANICGLIYEEHVIVCPTKEYFSFRDAGLIKPAPRGGLDQLDVTKAAAAKTRRTRTK
jgi:DNA repair protein RadC